MRWIGVSRLKLTFGVVLGEGFWFLEFGVAGWTGIGGSLRDLPCFQPRGFSFSEAASSVGR